MNSPAFQLHLKGFVGGYDFDADYVDYVLDRNKGKHVDVLIDSLGGYAGTALSIAAAFARHGDVTVHYVGMNASAATIAGMGAKEIVIDENALWLVHNSLVLIDICKHHNAADMAALIKALEKQIGDRNALDQQITRMYAKRCKRTPRELADLMAADKWLTAQEALEWGFVDRISESVAPVEKVKASVVCAMKEAGMPIPDTLRGSSLTERISAAVTNALESLGLRRDKSEAVGTGLRPVEAASEADSPEYDTDTKNSENMNQETSTETAPVAAPVAETPATTEAPAAAPVATASDEIAQLRQELAQARADIATLRAQLDETPGTESTQVVSAATTAERSDNPLDTLASDIMTARDLMKGVGL